MNNKMHPFTEEELKLREEFLNKFPSALEVQLHGFGTEVDEIFDWFILQLTSRHKKLIDVILREVGEVQQDFVNQVWNGKEDPNNIKYFSKIKTLLNSIKENL